MKQIYSHFKISLSWLLVSATFIFFPLVCWGTAEKQTVVIPILMYHHVGELPAHADKIRQDLTVSPEMFEEQVGWLSEQGFHAITLDDVYLLSQGKFDLPTKPIIFTFDDGYSDVFQNAVAILKKYNYVGSFGIITQWPGITKGTDQYASWAEIGTAQKEGMEIVSHTQNHFDGKNKRYGATYIEKNIAGSIADIKNHVGTTTRELIYPLGHYDARYIVAARQAGIAVGVTEHQRTTIHLNELMELPRIRVRGQKSLKSFKWAVGHFLKNS